MLHLRRSALRLLSSSPSASLTLRSRATLNFQSSPLRISRKATFSQISQRWLPNEAEAKQDDDAPISKLEASLDAEVENTIQEDQAQATDFNDGLSNDEIQSLQSTPAAAEPTYATENTEQRRSPRDGKDAGRSSFQRQPPSSRGPAEDLAREPKRTIYIGNLFFDVTENDLMKELSRFGTITKCRLIRDARGLSKGFGYIDFENLDSATEAIKTLNQQMFEGRRLAVQYAAFESSTIESRQRPTEQRRPLNPPSQTLFIGNMSFEMTDRDLNDLFRGIRNVIDVRVAIDRRTGQPRGFAHADFIDVKSAMDAMKVLDGKETYGRKLRIDFSYGPSNAVKNRGPE